MQALKGVWARTGLVAVAILLMTASLVLTKTGRDALYFQGDGLLDLPKAYLGMALLAGPMAAVVLTAMRRMGPRRARILAPIVAAGGLAAFSLVARPGGGLVMTVFFAAVPIVYGVLFSLSWLLASDLLDEVPLAQLGRPFALIGAASIIGGILGGSTARLLAPRIDQAVFLQLGAAALVLSVAVMATGQHLYPARSSSFAGEMEAQHPAVRAVLHQRPVLLMAAVAVAASLTGVLVEFQFFFAAATSGASGPENAAMFANLYTALNVGALSVQLLVVPALQRWIGIAGSLLILPAAIAGGAATLVASSSLLVGSIVRGTEGGLKSSIHRSNWEQTFVSLNRVSRSTAKLLIDGVSSRLGEGVAAVGLFIWLGPIATKDLSALDGSWLPLALLAAALGWFALERRLGLVLKDVVDVHAAPVVQVPVPDT